MVARLGRLGVLRDLVLFENPGGSGETFFMDRFESTHGDWHEYLLATGLPLSKPVQRIWRGSRPDRAEVDQPVVGITVSEARHYAAWRMCRLPRIDEWQFAVSNRRRTRFPWGNVWGDTLANTARLGLGERALVGTFEGDRTMAGIYDLIGNVAEWSETVAPRWLRGGARLLHPFDNQLQRAGRHPALHCWRLAPLPVALWWAIGVSGGEAPRFALGWHYMAGPRGPRGEDLLGPEFLRLCERLPGEYADTVGVRLAADPAGLLTGLLADPSPCGEPERLLIRYFLGRPRHREVLREARGRCGAPGKPGPIGRFLLAELGR